jgi:glycosyltransferase involved in cell wall biosynthesis
MKIGIDARSFNGRRSGVANNVLNLIKELMVIRPNDTFYLYSCRDFDNPLIDSRVIKRVGRTLLSKSGVVWLYTECKRAVLEDGIDVFWAPCGMLPKLDTRVKTILTINDFVWKKEPESMKFLFRMALTLLSRPSIKNAAKIFTISEAVALEMEEFMNRRPDAVIRPAADGSFYRRNVDEIVRVKEKYGIIGPYFLIVGTLEPRKNLEAFLRAFYDIRTTYAEDGCSKLVIAGGKGWKYTEIVKLIDDAEERGWAQCIGYVDDEDLPALYSGADIFFMPSRYEGFGMPVLEARCCGTPLVVADVPAMHEAGGDAAFYHSPTYEGIYEMLKRHVAHKNWPSRPRGEFVSWSWQSGALQLSQIIDHCFSYQTTDD